MGGKIPRNASLPTTWVQDPILRIDNTSESLPVTELKEQNNTGELPGDIGSDPSNEEKNGNTLMYAGIGGGAFAMLYQFYKKHEEMIHKLYTQFTKSKAKKNKSDSSAPMSGSKHS